LAPLHIGVIGDVHLRWSDADVAWFDAADHDLLLFVGDLGGYRHRDSLEICRSIGKLRKRALVIPGNHDGPSLAALAAEVLGRRGLLARLNRGQRSRVDDLAGALGAAEVVGYSRHPIAPDLDLIAARPHSMGGPDLHFAGYLRDRFGVSSLAESARRLRALVDGSSASRVLFLAHNGPTGLGDRREDIWGCDFRAEEGDQGDPDLADAVAYAREVGKTVVAVVAGHMHQRLKGGGLRAWQVHREGTLYVNAARVPRVFSQGGRALRHHVRLTIDGDQALAEEVLVPG